MTEDKNDGMGGVVQDELKGSDGAGDDEARERFAENVAEADAVVQITARWHEVTEEEADEHDDIDAGDVIPEVSGGQWVFDEDLPDSEAAEIMLRCIMAANEQIEEIGQVQMIGLALAAGIDGDTLAGVIGGAPDDGLLGEFVDDGDDAEGGDALGFY